jgi:hypothetical protein
VSPRTGAASHLSHAVNATRTRPRPYHFHPAPRRARTRAAPGRPDPCRGTRCSAISILGDVLSVMALAARTVRFYYGPSCFTTLSAARQHKVDRQTYARASPTHETAAAEKCVRAGTERVNAGLDARICGGSSRSCSHRRPRPTRSNPNSRRAGNTALLAEPHFDDVISWFAFVEWGSMFIPSRLLSTSLMLLVFAAGEARAEQTIVFFRHGKKPSGGYGRSPVRGSIARSPCRRCL